MPGQVPANFPNRLDGLIRERGLTNLEVAFRVGVTEKTVVRWRRGEADPYPRHARALADAFGGEWSDYTSEEAA